MNIRQALFFSIQEYHAHSLKSVEPKFVGTLACLTFLPIKSFSVESIARADQAQNLFIKNFPL